MDVSVLQQLLVTALLNASAMGLPHLLDVDALAANFSGPILLGTIINVMMYGMFLVQLRRYFHRFTRYTQTWTFWSIMTFWAQWHALDPRTRLPLYCIRYSERFLLVLLFLRLHCRKTPYVPAIFVTQYLSNSWCVGSGQPEEILKGSPSGSSKFSTLILQFCSFRCS